MNRNVHDTDDFFRSAYHQFEENPSPLVWEKISSELDQRGSISNKGKYKVWKKVIILLLLIPVGFELFDSDILSPVAKHAQNRIVDEKSSPAGQSESNIDATNSAEKKSIQQDQKTWTPKHTIVSPNANLLISGGEKSENMKSSWVYVHPGNYELAIVDPLGKASDYLMDYENTNKEKQKVALLSENKNTPAAIKIGYNKQGMNDSFEPYWLVTAFGSYDMLNYKLESDIPNNISTIKHREVHEPSFSSGILATRQITRQWGLQTGLVFSFAAIGIQPHKMYAFQDPVGDIAYKFVTSSGYAYIKPGGRTPVFGDSLTAPEAKHTLNSISVPVSAKYRVGKNKLTVAPGAGIEASFITSSKLEVEITDASNREIVFVKKLNGTKSFYCSAIADVELQYKLNSKLSLNLHPTFRYAISPITENNVVETYPYSFGIRAGITRKF